MNNLNLFADNNKPTVVLIDASNMFYRARHAVRSTDIDLKIGMAFHVFFSAISKASRDFDASHVIMCLEGNSWRYEIYPPYKGARIAKRNLASPSEKEEDAMLKDAFDELGNFFMEKTNCTVLQHPEAEADDFIARFIQLHPQYNHVIISTDTDFYQLLSDNVVQYNGVDNKIISISGVFDDKYRPIIDKKTKQPMTIGDPKWALFLKCIRGDTSDSIFSASPGARTKGTKNVVGIEDAFADRDTKGFAWNNFMLQRWVDHENIEHRVLDDYERNVKLIDLTQQPDHIKQKLDEAIATQTQRPPVPQIGIHLMKFCGKHRLNRLLDNAQAHAIYLAGKFSDIK